MKRLLLQSFAFLSLAALHAQPLRTAAVPLSVTGVAITSVNTTVCAEGYLKVQYRAATPFAAGNMFTVELSDAAGSFAQPVALRSMPGTGGGVVSAPVPSGAAGSGYRIRIVSTSPASVSPDNGADITINPVVGVDPVPNQWICPGDIAEIRFMGNAPNYAWTVAPNNVGIPTTGTTDGYFGLTMSNSTGSTQQVTLKVRAVSDASCMSKAMAFRITVWPKPVVAQVQALSICRNEAVPATMLTGSMPGAHYGWVNNNSAIGLPPSGDGNIPAFTSANPGATAINALIRVTALSAQGCLSDTMVWPVTVQNCGISTPVTGDGAARLRSAITVGPNPARGNVRLAYRGNGTRLTVEVRDAFGRTAIRPQALNSSTLTLNTEPLFAGSYFAVVTDAATGTQVSIAFVKL